MRSDDRADDHSLLARIARRDATALERLYALYRPRLWRYLWQQQAFCVTYIYNSGWII